MRVLVCGGRGFIGSHLMHRLAAMGIEAESYDLTDGQDARDLLGLVMAMRGCDTVVHLASNADIASAQKQPMIDFDAGTSITATVVEACRICKVETILYASGSGVYGDGNNKWLLSESDATPETVSPYGASKIAGEALVSAYCHMFGIHGVAFRFANVVGPGQTHGVGYDFINKLRVDSQRLEILGDGTQTKSYLHVDDAIDAMFVGSLHKNVPFTAYNVATTDYLTVTEIAHMASEVMGHNPEYAFTGGRRGWPGDVPVIRLSSAKIRRLGWSNGRTSREAMRDALKAMA